MYPGSVSQWRIVSTATLDVTAVMRAPGRQGRVSCLRNGLRQCVVTCRDLAVGWHRPGPPGLPLGCWGVCRLLKGLRYRLFNSCSGRTMPILGTCNSKFLAHTVDSCLQFTHIANVQKLLQMLYSEFTQMLLYSLISFNIFSTPWWLATSLRLSFLHMITYNHIIVISVITESDLGSEAEPASGSGLWAREQWAPSDPEVIEIGLTHG